ncbi:MAG: hypothetical protein KF833_09265 [Verrucomicrobiae bacterium]|nr:hypothetical protein [Verrucomicrobiae bacterium]
MKPLLVIPLLLLLGPGCSQLAQKRAERELEMVARHWCMTLRASQIIPTYPLNEDLQPGDVFLTETPAPRQARDYNRRGYLDLEHLLVRLNPTGYQSFYGGGYGIPSSPQPPRPWQFPDSARWSNAPLAGFPTYTIEVKRGGGFNTAFPISSVPVSLALLSSAQGRATVQLTQAHTFGLDQASLETPFRDWLARHPDLIEQYARPTNLHQTAYLRLVTRVFLVKSVNVTVTGDSATSFTGSGGVPREVVLSSLHDTNAVANYTNSIGILDRMVSTLQEGAPGGTLKLAGASSRAISFNETFARPLVVGYIAQDYPILPDGRLGHPVSTKEVLEGRARDPLSLSLQRLEEEQDMAARVAEACIARLDALGPDPLATAIRDAHRFNLLSATERDTQLAVAAQDPPAARRALSGILHRKARSGDVRARCDLTDFLESLALLSP